MKTPKITGRKIEMGKLINHGWSTSSDEIPQPISILMGRNLRRNSDETSKKPKQKPEKKKPPPKK